MKEDRMYVDGEKLFFKRLRHKKILEDLERHFYKKKKNKKSGKNAGNNYGRRRDFQRA